MQTIYVGTIGIFFVDERGGSRKTYLFRALLSNFRSRGMIGLETSTSRVAAYIVPKERKTHLIFEIPLETNESTMTTILK